MSVVAPLAATAALVPTVYGIAIGERPAALALSGIALAVVGVALAGRSESDDDGGPLARGVGLALLAALCFGLGFIALDTASEGGVTWTLLANRLRARTRPRLGARCLGRRLRGRRRRRAPRLARGRQGLPPRGGRLGDYAAVLGIGVLDLAAVGLFAVASTQGLVSVVSTLGSLYPVATVVLARLLLKERLTRGRLAGVTVAMAGVVAISAA